MVLQGIRSMDNNQHATCCDMLQDIFFGDMLKSLEEMEQEEGYIRSVTCVTSDLCYKRPVLQETCVTSVTRVTSDPCYK